MSTDEPSSPAELKELLILSGTEATLRPLAAQIPHRRASWSKQRQKEAVGRATGEAQPETLNAAFDPERPLAIMADVYGRHFTKQDVRDLLAFYRTPLGRKFAAHQPVLNQEMQEAAQTWTQAQMAAVSR